MIFAIFYLAFRVGGLPGAADWTNCTRFRATESTHLGQFRESKSGRPAEIATRISRPGDKDALRQQTPPVREHRSGSGSCRVDYSIVDHTLGKLR